MPWRSFRSTDHTEELKQILESFITSESVEESRRIVEQHPEVVGAAAEALLEKMAQAQESIEARRVFNEHRKLLRRCREAGIADAFAELQPSGEALVHAEDESLTPEQFLAQM